MSIPRSQTRHDMIEVGVRLSQILSVPKSTGQVYGLLYLTVGPLSLDDLVEQLGISKASASMATRQLASWGAIRRIWVPENGAISTRSLTTSANSSAAGTPRSSNRA